MPSAEPAHGLAAVVEERLGAREQPAAPSGSAVACSSMFHLWKRFAKKTQNLNLAEDTTREPDPKHLEQKHNGSIQ